MQQIKIKDNLIDVISCYGAHRTMLGAKRNSIEITMTSDYETIVNTFTDGITYSLIETTENEDETIQTHEYDKSSYCLAGDVVDHRDGTISIYMGMKTELELEKENTESAIQNAIDIYTLELMEGGVL